MQSNEPEKEDDGLEASPPDGSPLEYSAYVDEETLAGDQGQPAESAPDVRSVSDSSGTDAATLAPSASSNAPDQPDGASNEWLRSGEGERFGDYLLESEIARGGMGVVYKATQASLGRPVALKMILAGELASDEDVRRFYAEAEAAAKLDHANIVPIYEFGQHADTHYFSMKLIEGGHLGSNLQELRNDLPRGIEILEKVCRAVAHAHNRGVLHRDLKPANILLDDQFEPFVTDLGLARHVDTDSKLTQTGAVVGTPSYMSPEQAAGSSDLTIVSDVYSLGAILYELLCGQPPFRGRTPMETLLKVLDEEPIRPSASGATDRSLEMIALKCLEKDPSRRYATALELAEDLKRWRLGEPIGIRAPSIALVTKSWIRQNFGRAYWILIVGLVGGLIAGFSLWNATAQREFSRNRTWVYEQITSDTPPFALMTWVPPDWSTVPSMVVFICAVGALGFVTALLVRTRNTSADIAAGLMVGVIAGSAAFFFAFATLTISVLEDSTDLRLLGLLASSPIDETPMLLSDQYPELSEMDRNQQINLLKQKILSDRDYGVAHGLTLSLIACALVFVGTGIAETAIAGPILRRGHGLWRAWGEYLYRSIPHVFLCTYIGMHLAATMIFGKPGVVFDGTTTLIFCGLVVAVIADLRKWSSWIRGFAVAGTCAAFLGFLFFDFPTIPTLARDRQSIAEAKFRAEAFPANNRLQLQLANTYQSAGVRLYNGGRLSAACQFFDFGIQGLESFNAQQKSYASDGLLGIAYTNLGHTLWQLGRHEQSIQTIVSASRAHPENGQLQRRMVDFLLSQGSVEPARELVSEYRIGDPSSLRVALQMEHAFTTWGAKRDESAYARALEDIVNAVQARVTKTTQTNDAVALPSLKAENLIQHWLMIRPLDRDGVDGLERKLLDDPAWRVEDWSALDSQAAWSQELLPLQVDLNRIFPEAGDHTAAFAMARFESDREERVTIALGSDDGFVLWLNGKQLGSVVSSRGYVEREDVMPAKLNRGTNTLLLRVNQNQGPWGFGLQIDGQDDWPADVKWLPKPTKVRPAE